MSVSLTLNDIRDRARKFSKDWAGKHREEASAQAFQIEFFDLFGINQRVVSEFEHKVSLGGKRNGYIDLFWRGMILIEMKSTGKDMEKAYQQAREYALALKPVEQPKLILICDFQHFHVYDLDDPDVDGNPKKTVFTLDELAEKIDIFGYFLGYQKRPYEDQLEANIKAAERMGKIHDRLKEIGYTGHQLELYLVRLLFCMFADDTGIFPKDALLNYLRERTSEDGSDLSGKLSEFFTVLDQPEERRLKTLDERLGEFPYVNGELFTERIDPAGFDRASREDLIECSRFDWSKISPAIFGAMFQSVLDPSERRNLGAHYTSEENILKVLHPLFLDELWEEFAKIRALKIGKEGKLNAFHEKIARLRFLDPACGCGNFLVVAYRELRILELEILRELNAGSEDRRLDIDAICKVNVDQFYGIELEEFPAQIARVALWLTDHQMNQLVSREFGQQYVRIPLKHAPTIRCANALTFNWEELVPKKDLSYIFGNPPFRGARYMSPEQKKELFGVFTDVDHSGNLDYVTCWYYKAAEYIQGTPIRCAFVSTNSIAQGEQPAILWTPLTERFGVRLQFAHQTFKWSNDAPKAAAVHCVIIGFGQEEFKKKKLYTYRSPASEPEEHVVDHLNTLLTDSPVRAVPPQSRPLCDIPEIGIGNQPIDGGNYLFKDEEKNVFLAEEPGAAPLFRRWYGSKEFIRNEVRWCLDVHDVSPALLRTLPQVQKRIEAVRQFRLASRRSSTLKLAETPRRFQVENRPRGNYLLIPKVSSERRTYVPIGFMPPEVMASDLVFVIPDATLYHFGVLTSWMHMTWFRNVCGRLKSDYRYSKDVVYNNFPWPKAAPDDREKIAELAQKVLDARSEYPDCSMADLYDPNLMPDSLLKAHQTLDRAVEKLYRREKFNSDGERLDFLFKEYDRLIAEESNR